MTTPKDYMNSSWLAKRYPDLRFDDETQRAILEEVIALGQLSPEKEAHYRETFASGKRVYVSRNRADNALVKDDRVLDVKEVRELWADLTPAQEEGVQSDQQGGELPIALFPGHGWFALTHEAVDLLIRLAVG